MANLNTFALIVCYLYFLLNPMLACFLNLKGGCSLSFHKENYLADFHFMFVSGWRGKTGWDTEHELFFIGRVDLFNLGCCFRTLGCDSLVTCIIRLANCSEHYLKSEKKVGKSRHCTWRRRVGCRTCAFLSVGHGLKRFGSHSEATHQHW